MARGERIHLDFEIFDSGIALAICTTLRKKSLVLWRYDGATTEEEFQKLQDKINEARKRNGVPGVVVLQLVGQQVQAKCVSNTVH